MKEYPSCKLLIVNESYTSRTCSFCGEINQELGGAEVFKCNSCEYTGDRDIHGSRNIQLRFFIDRCFNISRLFNKGIKKN